MGEIHRHLHQHQHHQQPLPVFEQRQQQKLITEQLPSPFFRHINLQYNNYHQQQIYQQLQNPQANHPEFFHNVQTHYFQPPPPPQYQEQQRRSLLEHHHPQSSFSPAVSRQDNNFRGIITSCIPVQLDLKQQPNLSENGCCRNDDDGDATTQCTSLALSSHSWQNQADFAMGELSYWKQFFTDISADRRNERVITDEADEDKDKEHHNHQPEINQNQAYGYDYDDGQETYKNRKLFGELEAICGHTSSSSAIAKSNHVGSGSGLSHQHVESLAKSILRPPVSNEFIIDHLNAKTAEKQQQEEMQPSSMVGILDHDQNKKKMNKMKKKKRKRTTDDMESMAKFFERLVRQLMNHQEVLYKKFVEIIERIDKERKEREESWRRREMEKLQLEASAKSHDRALASTREASIVANLEKLTGQTIHLIPPLLPAAARERNFNELSTNNTKSTGSSSKRWPKGEVEALILIRSKLEQRFQEPGFKGPLWEEISNTMSSMGFQRNAKRCKEKWENINKYFQRSKENPQKDRRRKLKTCEYFDKLEQLYSKSSIINGCCYAGNDNDNYNNINKQEESPNNIRQGAHKLSFLDFEGSCINERFEEISAMKSDVVGLVDEDDDDDDHDDNDNEVRLEE